MRFAKFPYSIWLRLGLLTTAMLTLELIHQSNALKFERDPNLSALKTKTPSGKLVSLRHLTSSDVIQGMGQGNRKEAAVKRWRSKGNNSPSNWMSDSRSFFQTSRDWIRSLSDYAGSCKSCLEQSSAYQCPLRGMALELKLYITELEDVLRFGCKMRDKCEGESRCCHSNTPEFNRVLNEMIETTRGVYNILKSVCNGNCTSGIDHCSPNPCQNGGRCRRTVAGYSCICSPGYSGKHCSLTVSVMTPEAITDLCSPDPCQNGATCQTSPDGYSCICSLGYTGQNCSTYAPCSPNPCQNAGRCRKIVAGYYCTCQDQFLGENCSYIPPNLPPASTFCTPQHGNWGNWGYFSECKASCKKRRTRACVDPPPNFCGDDCSGPLVQDTECSHGFCQSAEDY